MTAKRSPRAQVPLRLPKALKRQLEARAIAEGLSLNALVVRVLREHGAKKALPPEVLKVLRKSEAAMLRGLRSATSGTLHKRGEES